ncbi:MAG: UbiA family prenyltransferase [Pseudomonadota bacterium]|nr:UbiA family prenyltransferase [Pseudomonadota bacterium]
MIAALGKVVRAGEWWHYKLVPILAAFVATLVMLKEPVRSAWPAAAALLVSIAAGAAYVSLLNDLTDMDEDRLAGKANRMAGRSAAFKVAALAVPILIGLLFLFAWRGDPLLAGAYLAAWIAFSLYSVPPFRLKARGFAGVVADACGAHLFPTLVAILLAFRAEGRPVDLLWVAAGAAWALGYGLRGILWHQLGDRENDHTAGVRTFAARRSPVAARRIGVWIAFPLELAGLATLMWMVGSIIPLLLLGLYVALVGLRIRCWGMSAVLVQQRPKYLIWLHEYYDVFFPLALLAASALRHPQDLLAMLVYLLLFPHRLLQTFDDGWALLRLIYRVGRSRR